jgi:hypothetical protein
VDGLTVDIGYAHRRPKWRLSSCGQIASADRSDLSASSRCSGGRLETVGMPRGDSRKAGRSQSPHFVFSVNRAKDGGVKEEKTRRSWLLGKGYQHDSISTAMVTLYNLGRSSKHWDTFSD